MKKVIVRAFGARLLGGEAADSIANNVFWEQNKLWNKLVEIDRGSREAYRAALSGSDSELAELEAAGKLIQERIDLLLEQRNKARSRAKSKKADQENGIDVSAKIRAAYAEAKELRIKMKERRIVAKEVAKPVIYAAEESRRLQVKTAAAESCLWWCHSETVLAKYDVARVRAMREGTFLQFRRTDGSGSMGVRFSVNGGSLAKIQAGKTDLLRMRKPTSEELGRMSAVKSDGGRRIVMRLRAGSKTEDGDIPALEFLVTMHAGMELPEDIPLKTVTATRVMHVHKSEWRIVLTFSHEVESIEHGPLPEKAAGIDLGWRLVSEETGNGCALRVAAISYGPDERVAYVTLGSDWIRRMERADKLRSELDDSSNSFAAKLLPMLTDEALSGLEEDDWFRVVCGKAKRAKRAYPMLLVTICDAHSRANKPLGDEIDLMMQEWRRECLRLATIAHHTRRKAIDHRKHVFRNAAAQIVKRAGLIGMDGINLRQLAAKKQPDGSDNELAQTIRRNRTWAAPSEFRMAVEQAAKRDGREIVDVDPMWTTTTCSSCGHKHGGPIEDLVFVCQGCGKVWDQDENAAHNIRNFCLKLEE